MSLIVVGSANMDLVVQAARFPEPGETILGSAFATYPGGKGANQAVAAGRLRGDVKFVGRVGADSFGGSLRQSLIDAWMDITGLTTDPDAPTGVAAITVTDSGQNTIVVAPGANSRVTASEVLPHLRQDAVLLMQLEIPIETVVELCMKAPAKLKILNPAPAASLPTEVYPCIDLITPNETEAKLLTGIEVADFDSAHRAADKLHDRGTKFVVITMGDRGAFFSDGESAEIFPALKTQVVDTTAAGDAFSGGLGLFLSQGMDIRKAIRQASIVAALSTTKPGAQSSMPTLEEVEAYSKTIP